MIVHAGLVALWLKGRWRGALIEGPSGAGKSDLALRCLSHGFRMVADDRVRLFRSGETLFGRAPPILSGLVELRGIGVLPAAALRFCRIDLLVVCGKEGERTPEPARETRLDVLIPTIRLAPLEPSAPAKLSLAIAALGADAQSD